MRTLALALCCALASLEGCTFTDGEGFARLSVNLGARFDLDSARLDDGWLRTDNDFALRLSTLALGLRAVELLGPPSGPTATGNTDCKLDPAHPPEGCGLCHGGHCHCDGALTSYEELEAQLCPGGATEAAPEVLARLPLSRGFDLLGDGEPRPLEASCEPSCELDRGNAVGLRLVLEGLTIAARLEDRQREPDRLGGGALDVAGVIELHDATLVADLDPAAPLDRDAPYELQLSAALKLPATLFDGVDWASLEREGGRVVIGHDHGHELAEALTTRLAGATLAVTSNRSDEHEHEHEHEEHEQRE